MDRVIQHVKGIFTSGEGTYINEQGEEVHGKLPREKLENPFHILKRPTGWSESPFYAGILSLSPTSIMVQKFWANGSSSASQTTCISLSVGQRGQWMDTISKLCLCHCPDWPYTLINLEKV